MRKLSTPLFLAIFVVLSTLLPALSDASSPDVYLFPEEQVDDLTDSILPRMDITIASSLYRCTDKVVFLLQEAQIPFCAASGTLLGAVRHGGIIPWDDDVDLAFPASAIPQLLALKEALEAEGLAIYTSGHYFKIYAKEGDTIAKSVDGECYPWRHPFIDLFPYTYIEETGRWEHLSLKLRDGFPNDYFLPDEIEVLFVWQPFGPTVMPLPEHPERILDRLYGTDWTWSAYADYNHRLEQRLQRVKVTLTDFSPAPWHP